MKKIAPKHIHTVNNFDTENAEFFDDFLSNIDEFQQKFDINTKEYAGRVKTQKSLQVVDIKQVKKNTKRVLF